MTLVNTVGMYLTPSDGLKVVHPIGQMRKELYMIH